MTAVLGPGLDEALTIAGDMDDPLALMAALGAALAVEHEHQDATPSVGVIERDGVLTVALLSGRSRVETIGAVKAVAAQVLEVLENLPSVGYVKLSNNKLVPGLSPGCPLSPATLAPAYGSKKGLALLASRWNVDEESAKVRAAQDERSVWDELTQARHAVLEQASPLVAGVLRAIGTPAYWWTGVGMGTAHELEPKRGAGWWAKGSPGNKVSQVNTLVAAARLVLALDDEAAGASLFDGVVHNVKSVSTGGKGLGLSNSESPPVVAAFCGLLASSLFPVTAVLGDRSLTAGALTRDPVTGERMSSVAGGMSFMTLPVADGLVGLSAWRWACASGVGAVAAGGPSRERGLDSERAAELLVGQGFGGVLLVRAQDMGGAMPSQTYALRCELIRCDGL